MENQRKEDSRVEDSWDDFGHRLKICRDNIFSASRGGQNRDTCFARRAEKDEKKELQQ